MIGRACRNRFITEFRRKRMEEARSVEEAACASHRRLECVRFIAAFDAPCHWRKLPSSVSRKRCSSTRTPYAGAISHWPLLGDGLSSSRNSANDHFPWESRICCRSASTLMFTGFPLRVNDSFAIVLRPLDDSIGPKSKLRPTSGRTAPLLSQSRTSGRKRQTETFVSFQRCESLDSPISRHFLFFSFWTTLSGKIQGVHGQD